MSLIAISPIDGRYFNDVKELYEYFSEYALIRYRVLVEIEYFIYLLNLFKYDYDENNLRMIYNKFDINEANIIKDIEKETNHDVKSVEYYIKSKITKNKELVHYGLTSQDINSVAYTLQIKDFIKDNYLPLINKLMNIIGNFAKKYINQPMLSRTHGQPASPTTLGKEFMVFYERLNNQIITLNNIKFRAKYGGAIGKLNAHYLTYPEINWENELSQFLSKFELLRHKFTTQIDHYDNYSEIFDNIKRINIILVDMCGDIWLYISNNYFHLKTKEGEIGSSTMPHKINPINFEKAKGNLLMSNSMLNFMSEKLPISTLQRDLTDSTVIRNMGTMFSHTIIAFKEIIKGFNKLQVNYKKINNDLDNNWVIISEGVQTILRKYQINNAYEILKDFTRNYESFNKDKFHQFIKNLNISENIKNELFNITPYNYIGKNINFNLIFVTGNNNKFKEAKKILHNIEQFTINLPEIQSTNSDEIINQKIQEAHKYIIGSFFCEDISLEIKCLNNFPGPLIKWMINDLKSDGIANLVLKYDTHDATAICNIGYYDGIDYHIIKGKIDGKIVSPRGNNNFGFDNIFMPKGYNQTFAEMDIDLKNSISHRYLALKQLKKFIY